MDVRVDESVPVSFDEDVAQEAGEFETCACSSFALPGRSGISQCLSSVISELVLCVCS